MANTGLHGHLNTTYGHILESLAAPKVLRRLKSLSRIKLFHSLAICATQDGRIKDALMWFEKVRRQCVKARDAYWLGQYLINSGVAFDVSGDSRRAATAFQKAIKHGKAHKQPSLVGRSLGNLAQIRMREDETDAAVELMRQSIKWKKDAKDEHGSAMASAQLGSVEANRGNLRVALGHFTEAEALFAEQGDTYNQAKSRYNVGNVYADLGELPTALVSLKQAHRIANDENYIDLFLLAVQRIAGVRHSLGRFPEIEAELNELLRDPRLSTHNGSKLTAYHGIGIAQIFQGRSKEGRANLRRALELARKLGEPEWAVKAILGLSGSIQGSALKPATTGEISRLANLEERRGCWSIAGRLSDVVGDLCVSGDDLAGAEAAYSSAALCFEKTGHQPGTVIASYFKLYVWRWRAGLFEKAIETLKQTEAFALVHEFNRELIKAVDERGLSLQRLGRADQAAPLHSRAVRLAEKHNLPTQLRTSLNNLGQAYRRLGRFDEATASLQESEDMARAAGDYKAALGTMVNRGMVLLERRDHIAAGRVLRKCSAEAERRANWREYVMGQEALGNLAWHRKRLKDAEVHYRKGYVAAKNGGLKDSQAEIAVNYASLLEKTGRSKQALRVLRVYESEFSAIIDPHVCHDVLAGLYLANREPEAARRNWESGRVFARSGLSDTHVPREATRLKPAPRGRSSSVGYLTLADDLILLSITVIADMVSTVSAPRCFRSLTDSSSRRADRAHSSMPRHAARGAGSRARRPLEPPLCRPVARHRA